MPVILHILGGLIGISGLLMTGFALPIRDFSFGNTLILAGAIAIVGGLLLIAFGSALRELRKLSHLLERASPPSRPELPGKPPVRSPRVTGPIPPPVVPPARPARPEPRVDAELESSEREPEPAPMPASAAERPQRPSIFALVRGSKTEHFEIDESESVPLSPVASPRGPALTPERAGVAAEPLFEPKPEPRTESRAEPRPETRADARMSSPAALASRTAARIDMPRPVPELPRVDAERPVERAERSGRSLFDTVWPTEAKREPSLERAPSERIAAERYAENPMFAPPEPPEARKEVFNLAHAAVKEAVESLTPEEEAHQESKFDPRPEPKPVTILKSGVIDGMAYTLYTDGSIEAQLPNGLMRFASIDDLRTYLERHT